MDLGSKKLEELIEDIKNMSVEEYEALYERANEDLQQFASPLTLDFLENQLITSGVELTWTTDVSGQLTGSSPGTVAIWNPQLPLFAHLGGFQSQPRAFETWMAVSDIYTVYRSGTVTYETAATPVSVGNAACICTVTIPGIEECVYSSVVSDKGAPEEGIYRPSEEEKEGDVWPMAA